MKAIIVNKPFDMEMIDVKEPMISNSNEVKVRIRAFGICGSDVGIFKGTNPFAKYPRVLGHEISGEVVEVGNDVTNVSVGDLVVLEPIEFCEKCYACNNGRHNVCNELEVYGVHRDGGLCEYMVTDCSKWHRVDPSLEAYKAVVAEPYTIAEQSTSRAQLKEGDFLLVTGAGPAGLLIIDVAVRKGAIVIVSELNDKRRNLAKEFGASYIINPAVDNLGDRIFEITNGEGVNVFIDTSGVYGVIEEGLKHMSAASRFVPLAFGSDNIPLNFKTLNQKEIDVKGTRLQYEKFPIVASYIHDKKDLLDKFVTHVFKAEDYKKAFELFMTPGTDAVKVVITFD